MKILSQNLKFLAIAVGVVFVWRGVWGLADEYLFPDYKTLSFIASILIGILILLFVDWKKKDIRELG
jgi:hypothetical protein